MPYLCDALLGDHKNPPSDPLTNQSDVRADDVGTDGDLLHVCTDGELLHRPTDLLTNEPDVRADNVGTASFGELLQV